MFPFFMAEDGGFACVIKDIFELGIGYCRLERVRYCSIRENVIVVDLQSLLT